RSLAEEPIIRLILDGTVVRVRLDRKATAIVLLVVLGVREDGQKVLLAAKNMGGETNAAWRAVPPCRPETYQRPRPSRPGLMSRRSDPAGAVSASSSRLVGPVASGGVSPPDAIAPPANPLRNGFASEPSRPNSELRCPVATPATLGASGRSPTKRLWIVKRQARVHGRRRALQLE